MNNPVSCKAAPCSPETERSVLSTAMAYPHGYASIVEVIGDRPVFFEKVHEEIWHAIQTCYVETPDTRPDYCQLLRHLDGVDLPGTYLHELAGVIAMPSNAGFHAQELLRLWKVRTTRDRAASLARCADAQDVEGMEAVLADLNADITDGAVNPLPIASIHNAPDPGKPLFRHGLPAGMFGVVVGSDGAGKSYLMLDILLSCCLGRAVNVPSLARTGPPLRCVYIGFEDPDSAIRFRATRLLDAAGLPRETLQELETSGTLTVITEAGPLFVQEGRDMPKPTDTLSALRRHISRNRTDILVIDPLRAAALLQNENDNSAQNSVAVQLRRMAAETGTAIILVHHANKAAGRAGRAVVRDHQIGSGGGALVAAARWEMNLTVDTDDKDCLEMAVAKNSYGARLYGVVLARDPETGVLRELSGQQIGKAKEALLAAVVEYIGQNPGMINPNAVRLNRGEAAQGLIKAVDAKPKDVHGAIIQGLTEGLLDTLEQPKKNGQGTHDVLVIPDPEEVPF